MSALPPHPVNPPAPVPPGAPARPAPAPAAKANKAKALLYLSPLILMFLGLGIAWFVQNQRDPYVQVVNGFDFAVKVTLTDEDGDATVVEVPSGGRVGIDLAGSHQLDVETADGKKIVEDRKVKFTESGKQKKRCFQYLNVGGSAAIFEEDIVYGVGIKGGGKLTSGETLTRVCPTWGFETKEPPESISVKEGSVGQNHTWLHYVDDGDWTTSIKLLLAKKPRMGDQDRIRAWNIAVIVYKVDPKNAKLKALGPEFKAACGRIVDMFTTGPLAGQAQKKCLANAKAVFPAAF